MKKSSLAILLSLVSLMSLAWLVRADPSSHSTDNSPLATATPLQVVDAYSRFRDGPVFVPGDVGVQNPTKHQVATLDVTAGLYAIFAKGFVKAHGGGGSKVECQISADADSDRARLGVSRQDSDGDKLRTDEEAFALNVMHAFNGLGTISLKCSADADDVDFSSVKITAIRVNSYINLPQ